MNRPSISLAMIVKNEEKNLPNVLNSVKDCVDEIIIVDTGSTDGTIDVAHSFGAQVSSFQWVDDFAAARNDSFSKVKTDYALWLDGDDALEGKENFIAFRNEVMKIADYWVAPYHYASHADGTSACTFVRERVINMKKGLKWSYFVHEGINPNQAQFPINIQAVNGWCVRHKRTEEDVKQDKSRNLILFEKNLAKGPLDARMRYYYGKELFENGKTRESIAPFSSAISDQALEIHDRILATQYLASAYLSEGNFIKAIELCHIGLLIDPNRAEFYCIIADCYLKQMRPMQAAPYLHAAKGCQRPQAHQATAIFYNGSAYFEYPKNQLARVYFHMGDIKSARREAVESLEATGSGDARAVLMEIDQALAVSDFSGATPCADIVFTTPPQNAYEFDPGIAQEKSMGGSETALIEMAKHMKAITGKNVKVFAQRNNDAIFDGVEYLDNRKLINYMSKHKPLVHIAWRHNIKMTNARTFVWSHDLETPGAEAFHNYEKIFCLTPFHKTYMKNKQMVPDEKIWVTRNGINPDRFKDGPWEKDQYKFVFSSSPDRGLDRAMRVLDKVREVYPLVKLHVFYGIEHLEKYGLGDMQKMLKGMMDERKDWVIYHGATQQDEMMKHFKTASYCVQPSDWIETSMISAVERLCCGIYQIMRAVGGCVDTLKSAERCNMATLVNSECITESEYAIYIAATLKAIKEQSYKNVYASPDNYSWEKVAKDWSDYMGLSYLDEEMRQIAGA